MVWSGLYFKSLISIHALLAESDVRRTLATVRALIFLSTLSLRRATRHEYRAFFQGCDFYPRSPCGERLPLDEFQDLAPDISIHALLAESD